MSWETKINSKRSLAAEYAKDAEVLAELALSWPAGAAEPDSVDVAPAIRNKVTANFWAPDEKAGEEIARNLRESFHIDIPGMQRKFREYDGKVAGEAEVVLGGIVVRLHVSHIGAAPNCRIVPITKTVEQTTWEMVCEEEKP